MKKKNVIYFSTLLIIIISLYFLFFPRYLYVHEIMNPYKEDFTPNGINVSVRFSYLSSKEFKLDSKYLVNELVEFLGNIKVRRVLIRPKAEYYTPRIMNTYKLTIHSIEGKVLGIEIKDHNYIEIRGQIYKIIENVDLTKIYELILRGQDRDSVDEFYFDIIKQK
ncbi:hypothetical protein [Paramaledivibacter caminithermalis]|jgi:hypothetical protein|uniref:Uncharacterized protein n=1 Tax=Paramaledivibacter caminithermalis (strain DSM 15212 / CIP 107654 / DViRD3) TaxID=1121301 RepID=A0A1M6K3C4_PARC5|nr:hypothetical protein [Paramaledivibacter caminithermalis]SHJ53469.1 hypothetical protein SAMN02745912_00243 [Paramaledivibacter caminithermalis DSM 15212]